MVRDSSATPLLIFIVLFGIADRLILCCVVYNSLCVKDDMYVLQNFVGKKR